MIDFLEYVVTELKSKRLSKAHAVELVKQFSRRGNGSTHASMLHPLVHGNSSDLEELRFSARFSGSEFFLADHQVRLPEGLRSVMPAVAYLEMARAAMTKALPSASTHRVVELRDTIWATPVVVGADGADLHIALTPATEGLVDYEIYSGQTETVHCRGRALSGEGHPAESLTLNDLRAAMNREAWDGAQLYARCGGLGLEYGAGFQGVVHIAVGEGQLLARLQLPESVKQNKESYGLHPSLLDSALQSSLALMNVTALQLPFALERLRLHAPCEEVMWAWVRHAGSGSVTKLDVDLCNAEGMVCVQLRGFSARPLHRQTASEQSPSKAADTGHAGVQPAGDVEAYVCRQLADILQLPAEKLDPRARLETYGIDSILAMKLTQRLEQSFGPLPKTLFFEYQTIRELSGYFSEQHAPTLQSLLAAGEAAQRLPTGLRTDELSLAVPQRSRRKPAAPSSIVQEPIAIVGLSGRYPEAENLAAYWRNLRDGKDCIVEVPKDRWDWRAYFSADRSEQGRHYSKWGGFIPGVDEFDPLFFHMSPSEAEKLDPQERLFLQHAWMALEDAGYTRESLQRHDVQDLPGQVGVYASVMYSEYQLFGAEATARGAPMGIAVSPSSIANRVSYMLNLHGPSLTVDTMCSSSLTAIHLACQDLKAGRIHTALAGGVNVSVHPNKYLVLSAGQFISSDGHCQSFGEGGDGYIPGEGVGVVVLKRLSDAERDGDQIYGVIRGSALNHGGRTNGYTVPNPQAQASVIARAMREAGIDARRIGYVEAHGTGTKLGDPIEIAALTKAFQTPQTGYCLLGSAKSNIGHCESAAGIAGLTKVLLQLKHRQIVPSLHSAKLNPHIDFAATPFVVNQALRSWGAPEVEGRTYPRMAGISSFGAGGSNAHMLVEEYPAASAAITHAQVVVPLSARTPEQLEHKVADLLAYLREHGDGVDLTALAYTLQVGREAMDERRAWVVTSTAQLQEALQASSPDGYRGHAKRDRDALVAHGTESEREAQTATWLHEGQLSKLAQLWTQGAEIAWERLYDSGKPRRISLPTYPFARERYWVELPPATPATAVLHPLLHSNTSDLREQRYSTCFHGNEFFLADHCVRLGGTLHKVLPGAVYLEMVRAAAAQALPQGTAHTVVELADTIFAQPMIAGPEGVRLHIALMPSSEGRIDYEIYSGEDETVHCQGSVLMGERDPAPSLSLSELNSAMTRASWTPEMLYARCAALGLEYGTSFQAVAGIALGEGQLLAELRLPATATLGADDYGLHPSLLDGALQAAVSLMEADANTLHLPFALERLRIYAPCANTMWAWIRHAASRGELMKWDIDLCDALGKVCVQLHGLSTRAAAHMAEKPKAGADTLLAVPYWEPVATAQKTATKDAKCHVLLCALPNVDAAPLAFALQAETCEALPWNGTMLAERYESAALRCFERVRELLTERKNEHALVQLLVQDSDEASMLAGLSGLLKTASLENPQIRTQLIRVPAGTTTEQAARWLQEETSQPETMLWRTADTRRVLRWREPTLSKDAGTLRDDGVYLITGGLGGLGLLFARAILAQAKHARLILCGRSALSESARAELARLGQVDYRIADVSERTQADALLHAIRSDYGRIDGILHSAGVLADSFLLKKSAEAFRRVLQPKVAGACHLDAASAQDNLDFFVLFASVTGVFGNLGQGDYAAANGFLDSFAAYRNEQVAKGERSGRSVSIDWPLWAEGGMQVDASTLAWLHAQGMQPLETSAGLAAWHACLALDSAQALVIAGDRTRIRQWLSPDVATTVKQQTPASAAMTADASELLEQTQDYLRRTFAGILKLAPAKIDAQEALETYGIDSVLAMRLTQALEQRFGALSKTLFFEYQSIAALAGHLLEAHGETLRTLFGHQAAAPVVAPVSNASPRTRRGGRLTTYGVSAVQDIAIVGVAGRYPQADNLAAFWNNLRAGRDCISEIPPERWDLQDHYDPDPNAAGKSYGKWGGFITDIDKFDPLFFNISPREATLIDPQERLFMQTVWETVEDAGYSKERIASRNIGVYVGVMWNQYELYAAQAMAQGETGIPLSSHASIANRVSYFYDFRGPSLAIDTMCSSSLTALHLACEALRKGDIEAAVAGGVNLTVHPHKYLNLSQGKFLSSDGRCRSFGEGGDGYVPGEGVGAVLLKPLQAALRDGDRVYAVIRSTAINHGGKTNGYSVPNPLAQAQVIAEACRKAGIEPASLGYIEAHGTGTALGDPIEITGLCKAFADTSGAKHACPIGSVKSLIGHLEAAAGMAALTKVLLQMKHGRLVPSLHATALNPHIDFDQTPFYVQTELGEWKPPATHPRRAGISSFGAGGANAHVIVEDYPQASTPASAAADHPEVFLLSARDAAALRRYAERCISYLDDAADVSLPDLAYTSQVGRTPMVARLAILATDKAMLRDKLSHWVARQGVGESSAADESDELEDIYDGSARPAHQVHSIIEGRAGKAFLTELLASRDLSKLLRLWTMGVSVDWAALRREGVHRPVSMPTYPFAQERYWVTGDTGKSAVTALPSRPPIASENSQRLYFRPYWRPAPLPTSGPVAAPRGAIWVLDDAPDLFLALKSARRSEQTPSVHMQCMAGAALTWIDDDHCVLDPVDPLQWRDLIAVLQTKNRLPGAIVHCLRGQCDLNDEAQRSGRLDQGVYALFYLCQALLAHKHPTVRIVSVYASADATAADRAMAGFLRSLQAEHPHYVSKTIEWSDAASTAADAAACILDELHTPAGPMQEVLYRRSARNIERVVRDWMPAPVASTETSLPLESGGVYVISGGLGGLGLIFAHYLAKRYRARLVLSSRSAPGATQRAGLAKLQAYGAEVVCVQADVSTQAGAQRIIASAKERFAKIDGVIHIAGVNRDGFLLKKTREDMDAVLAAKIAGATHLDSETSGEALKFFALFASVAGAFGNAGQADYAYANCFLDAFADDREHLRKAGRRSGRTLAIDWPYWSQGGMKLADEDVSMRERQTGLRPLPTEEGLQCWEDCLRSDAAQIMVLYGRGDLIATTVAATAAPPVMASAATSSDAATLYERTLAYLQRQIGEEIKLAPERIGSTDRFDSLGIDSVMINRLNMALENDLGALSKTLFYEYETPEALARYLLKHAHAPLQALFGTPASAAPVITPPPAVVTREAFISDQELPEEDDRIAIVGVHGRYPQAEDLDSLWELLREGRDLVGEVPTERWNAAQFYHSDPAAAAQGKIYCKWGGFLRDHDKFDAAFFNIPAEEAKIIDPQERLMLESAWAAIEDAGYTRETLHRQFPKGRSADVGVFIGVTTQSYSLLALEQEALGGQHMPANAMPWSIANRISYFFDFNGPSMPVDTACSSALVALHLACESLKRRECQLALVGGVNLYLHPAKYKSLCDRHMLSADGKCHSYGAGDDGFVPGEAVGTLVLKPLRRAKADGDHIYAVVGGSAHDHSGRSNGYSAPNPNAQAELIGKALQNAGAHPESISYIEGHGTGTLLGDSLEVAALTQAFQRKTNRQQFCPIGCVKANLGHAESAAGIASLTKVLLQLRQGELLPSIHAEQANPQIEFAQTPFRLQQAVSEWIPSPQHPRRALINGFGAGGVNACVVIEEYVDGNSATTPAPGSHAFVLSARNAERLLAYARRMLAWLKTQVYVDISALCYTLQVGREPMHDRLGLMVDDASDLIVQLETWCRHNAAGNLAEPRTPEDLLEDDGHPFVSVLQRWNVGEKVDWESLYAGRKPPRISLPTYPFARERHWITDGITVSGDSRKTESLHPLISRNTSTLRKTSFSSLLADDAFYATDHRVGAEAILPGAAFLEMACIAGSVAGEQRVNRICDIVWAAPLSFRHGAQHVRTHLQQVADFAEFIVASLGSDQEAVVYCEGRVALGTTEPRKATDAASGFWRDLMTRGTHQSGEAFYDGFRRRGFDYGAAFRTVQDIWLGETFALSRLKLPERLQADFGQFVLHPSLIDGAIQTIAGLVAGAAEAEAQSLPHVPFALDEVDIYRALPQVCYAHATHADAATAGWRQGVGKFTVTLFNEKEEILVVLKNLYIGALTPQKDGRQLEASL